MRGRGIGTARGRATIMRGMSILPKYISRFLILTLFSPSEWYASICFHHSTVLTIIFLARRGRGVAPPARGIRR